MRISDWSSDVCSSDLEINLRARAFGTLGQILHAGDERRDTDPATDPDLTGAIIVECEASIRPLDPDLLADMEFFGQAPRMIPQSLGDEGRSEEHTSELQSLMRISYAVFCLTNKTIKKTTVETTYI